MSNDTATTNSIDFPKLRQGIEQWFDLNELQVLCYDLSIKYDNLPGATLALKTIEVVEYCRRHSMVLQLVSYLQEKRPKVSWTTSIPQQVSSDNPDDREEHRHSIQKKQRYTYLVHTLQPSRIEGQSYDILIYLMRRRKQPLSEVKYAEFFFGKSWGGKIYHVDYKDDFIGIKISAYGPVLCTCKVVFTDDYSVLIDRYIDFEMGDAVSRARAKE